MPRSRRHGARRAWADAEAAGRVLTMARRAAGTYAGEIVSVENGFRDHNEAWSPASEQPRTAREPLGFSLILGELAECSRTLKALDHSIVAYDAMLGDTQSG